MSLANVRYVSVGNEPLLTSNNGIYDNVLVPALQNVYSALKVRGLDNQVFVTVAMNADILGESYPPSSGVFRSDITSQVQQVARILETARSPFSINIYPFLNLYLKLGTFTPSEIYLDRAVSTSNSSSVSGVFVDSKTGLTYTNVFDSTYDAVLAALASVGSTTVSSYSQLSR